MKNILLLEDEHDIAIMLRRILEEEGYYVTFTGRVADARNLLERIKFDLLIADVLLSDGTAFDAIDVAKRHCVPYFLMTGSIERMAQLEANGEYHLAKPFRLIDFMMQVRDRVGPAAAAGRN